MKKNEILLLCLFAYMLMPALNLNAQTSNDNNYVTLTCVVKNETEPTSQRFYSFIAKIYDHETKEKKIMKIHNEADIKSREEHALMDDMIDRGDTVILRFEKRDYSYSDYKGGYGFGISFREIVSINDYKVTYGK